MARTERELLEARAPLWDQMQKLWGDGDRAELTAEERETFDRLEKDIKDLSSDIDRHREYVRMQSAANEGAGADAERRGLSTRPEHLEDRAVAEREAMRAFLTSTPLSPEQSTMLRASDVVPRDASDFATRAQSIGTTTAGGFFVPPGYWQRISTALKAYGGLLNLANVLTTDRGQPLQWPNNDDTANVGALLGENVQVTEVDLAIGSRTLNAWTYTSNSVLASLQLLQDSAFDLDTWIPEKLAIRIGRILATHFITGSGTSQPIGITSTSGGYAPTLGVTGTGSFAGAPSAGLGPITYPNLVDLIHSVDPAYRTGRSQDPTYNPMGTPYFLMPDLELANIRKLTDSQNRPLWQPSVTAGDPDTLLGYPVQVDQAMPAPAVNSLSVAFGNFHEGYVVRQVLGVQMLRLVERYADFLQVGWIGFARFDARPDNGVAFKFFKTTPTA